MGGHTIQGNYIGLEPNGTTVNANNSNGVDLGGPNNIVGGTGAGERNVLSGNLGSGIAIRSSGNTVRGNFIGTDAAGVTAKGNGTISGPSRSGAGILIQGEADNNTIGGATAAARNLISGNKNSGLEITAIIGGPLFVIKCRGKTV